MLDVPLELPLYELLPYELLDSGDDPLPLHPIPSAMLLASLFSLLPTVSSFSRISALEVHAL